MYIFNWFDREKMNHNVTWKNNDLWLKLDLFMFSFCSHYIISYHAVNLSYGGHQISRRRLMNLLGRNSAAGRLSWPLGQLQQVGMTCAVSCNNLSQHVHVVNMAHIWNSCRAPACTVNYIVKVYPVRFYHAQRKLIRRKPTVEKHWLFVNFWRQWLLQA